MRNEWSGVCFLFPVFAGIYAAYKLTLLTTAMVIILIYLSVKIVPFCYKHENLWVFLISAVSMTPINAKIIYLNRGLLMLGQEHILIIILLFVMYCMILFSVEEIVFAFFARLIWKKQHIIHV